MKKKTSVPNDDRSWHNGGNIEIGFYARSLHRAAQTLITSLNLEPHSKPTWDACPVILLYRQAVELHLKTLVDEGGNFLKERTDPHTLYKTHSLRWLSQIVGQIIKAVRWENQFKCEGVASLADFSAVVNELEELEPVAIAAQSKNRHSDCRAPSQLQPHNIVRFAKKLDGLLDLMAVTADALAATWDQWGAAGGVNGFESTIQ